MLQAGNLEIAPFSYCACNDKDLLTPASLGLIQLAKLALAGVLRVKGGGRPGLTVQCADLRLGVAESYFRGQPRSSPAPREKFSCSCLDLLRLVAVFPLAPFRAFAASREPPLPPPSGPAPRETLTIPKPRPHRGLQKNPP